LSTRAFFGLLLAALVWGVLTLGGCGGGSSTGAEGAAPPAPPAPPASAGAISAAALGMTAGPIAAPAGAMKNIKDFGAVGDGLTDDTVAIQSALNSGRDTDGDYNGKPKALYFPAGTYLVSATLTWRGCCVTLQGQGHSASVIRLKDKASGFVAADTPTPVLRTPAGNASFRQNVWDLGIHTGSGNPGAVGVDWISSNIGSLRNVRISSGDGAGVRGLDMTRQWPGPSWVQGLIVSGFDHGVSVRKAEYGPSFENLGLENQNKAGLRNEGNKLALRRVFSVNSVPALQNAGGSVVLIDGTLNGGAAGAVAIENNSDLYLRDVKASGYASVLAAGVGGTGVAEYVAGAVKSLFNSNPARASLNLSVQETPRQDDADLAQWRAFNARSYGDTADLQPALDAGKSTVYFPFGVFYSFDQRVVVVPPSVKRIVGFSSVVNGNGAGLNGGGIRFVVNDNGSTPLVIEQFGYGVTVEHRGQRPVVIKHGLYRYFSEPGAGDLFLEDVGLGPLKVQAGQRVWARQFNNESRGTKISNSGTLWILGLKTEGDGTVIEGLPGSSTELLGTLLYPARVLPSADVAFRATDARMSLIYSVSSYVAGGDYATQVEETRAGVTKRLLQADVRGRMPLYVGY
jgi:Pectate lyase superfamily protein